MTRRMIALLAATFLGLSLLIGGLAGCGKGGVAKDVDATQDAPAEPDGGGDADGGGAGEDAA